MDILLLTDHSTQRSTIRINLRTQLSSNQISPQKNTCNCELKAETFLQLYNMMHTAECNLWNKTKHCFQLLEAAHHSLSKILATCH